MLFTVIARDGTDPEAPARRQAARQQHLAGVPALVERGTLQVGGALLDEDGTMCGSMLVLDLPDRAAVEEFLKADVYWQTGVWQEFEIFEFKRAA